MPALAIDAIEARLLGVLIEKETTTPDAYPLTINSLQNGANQKSNRDPHTTLTSSEITAGIERLRRKSLISTSHTSGARVEKYKHIAGSTWQLSTQELAVLAELMLRGAQQPGELRGRASRMTKIETLPELDAVLDSLRTRGFVQRLEPLPGTRAARWDQIVAAAPGQEVAHSADEPGSAGPGRTSISEGALPIERPHVAATAGPAANSPATHSGAATPAPDLAARVMALESEVAELRRLLDDLTS
jgi:uncharacterized protein